jgi:hypothetical protein
MLDKKHILITFFLVIIFSLSATIPFVEDWESQDFTTNNWVMEAETDDTWGFGIGQNNNFARMEITGISKGIYSTTLTSQEFTSNDDPEITLDFLLSYDSWSQTGEEHLLVEIWVNNNWTTIAEFVNDSESYEYKQKSYDLSETVLNETFKLRFKAYSNVSGNDTTWDIDNIEINNGCDLPKANLFGHVVSEDDNTAVNNAYVFNGISGMITYNEGGLEGSYGFEFTDLEPGPYTIECAAKGYFSDTKEIFLQYDETNEQIFELITAETHPAPHGIYANVNNVTDLDISWYDKDPYTAEEIAYDDSVADEWMNFTSMGNNLIVANKFSFQQEQELTGMRYYIKLNQNAEGFQEGYLNCYAVAEGNDGYPDLTNKLTPTFKVDNIEVTSQEIPGFWLEIPANVTIAAEQNFFICLEWYQENSMDSFVELGKDTNSECYENSFSSPAGGGLWMPMIGDYACNLMIRALHDEASPWKGEPKEIVGYNVYKDSVLVTDTPVSWTNYEELDLEAGEYIYNVTTVYDEQESVFSEDVTVNIDLYAGPNMFTEPYINFDDSGIPYMNVGWGAPKGVDVLGYNVYRNDELVAEIPNDGWGATQYHDYDIINLTDYTYYITADYEYGESNPSNEMIVTCKMPPSELFGVGYTDSIESHWTAPAENPDSDHYLQGYNVYINEELQNETPISATTHSFTQGEQNMNYEITVSSVYDIGESLKFPYYMFTFGEESLQKPTNLEYEQSNNTIDLSWTRPEGQGTWIHYDSNTEAEGFAPASEDTFSAIVHFDQWDLSSYDGYTITSAGFMPTDADANYYLQLWEPDLLNPNNFMLREETLIEDVTIGKWNTIDFQNSTMIYAAMTNVKIGIRVENYTQAPLKVDEGPNDSEKSDIIKIGENWENLSDYGMDTNWKIRLYLAEPSNQSGPGPLGKFNLHNRSISLNGYNIYRNDELIAEISDIVPCYTDDVLNSGNYTYEVYAVYNMMDCAIWESEPTNPVEVLIETYNPAQNLVVENTGISAVATWEAPATDKSKAVTGYDVYLNDNFADNTTELTYTFTDLIDGETYTAGVVAVYETGESEMISQEFTYVAESTDPPVMPNVQLNETGALFSWLEPGSNPGDEFSVDFEDGLPADWTLVDADGDGFNWEYTDELTAHSGIGCMMSASYDNASYTALTPDNYMITPQLTIGTGAELSFWYVAQDTGWTGDKVMVKVSTTDNNPDSFTDTLGSVTTGTSYEEATYDMSDYAGQNVYIALVHTDCTDFFVVNIDDISLSNASKVHKNNDYITKTSNVLPIRISGLSKTEIAAKLAEAEKASRELTGYNVYLDDELVTNTSELSYLFTDLVDGQTYTAGVTAVYTSGESEMVTTEFTWEQTSNTNGVPAVTALTGNYPNPFNPETTINFSMSEAGMVNIEIYNIKGQRVKTLVSEDMDAGNHSLVWNGRDNNNNPVSSGVYFYKMVTGKYTSTKKMILMK